MKDLWKKKKIYCRTCKLSTKLVKYILGIYLKETVKYSFFLKVWYNENTFAIFKSDGVTIATQGPAVTNIRGSSVSTSKSAACSEHLDTYNIVNSLSHVHVCCYIYIKYIA